MMKRYYNILLLSYINLLAFNRQLIEQGVHYIDNHMFKFEGFVKCSEKVIQHGR